MKRPLTLRMKLAIAYALALLVALVAFAAVTLVVVDRVQRLSLDDRLSTAVRAIGAIVEQRNGQLVLDANDRAQFGRIIGTRLRGAVLDRASHSVAGGFIVPDALRALAASVTPGSARMVTVTVGGEQLRSAVIAVPLRGNPAGAVVVWADLDQVVELERSLALVFATIIPLLAAFAVFAGGAVAARGLRPIDAIARLASEIEAHDLSRRLRIRAPDDELGRLARTFDRMLDRLEAAFEQQERFTSDASHELRAPLSVIRAEADLMLRRRRTPEEYERALRAIAAHADELEALTRDLLAAARADATAAVTSQGRVPVTDLTGGVVERLAPLARKRQIAVEGPADADVAVTGSETALRRAFLCVVHNALKYARSRVEIVAEQHDREICLQVIDDGPGFSSAALDHATERFWREDGARVRGSDEFSGTGLGLAIASVIVRASHGSLELRNAASGGAIVAIRLPAAES